MKRINGFIYKHAYLIAIILFSFAISIGVVAYIGGVITKFSAYTTAMFAFEAILHFFLIYALAIKNTKLQSLFLVAIKVFDAILFTAAITLKIDSLIAGGEKTHFFTYANFISYALSALLLIAILIFFFLNLFSGQHKYWKVMKVLIVVTIIVMFICSLFEIVSLVKQTSHWYAFLEPMYMCFLLLGMFTVCHYIESEK